MTSSEQVREEIARVLWTAECSDGMRAVARLDCRAMADAILARFPVLAGVTDEMVETGAKTLASWDGLDWGDDVWEGEVPRAAYRFGARAVLSAVLGRSSAFDELETFIKHNFPHLYDTNTREA